MINNKQIKDFWENATRTFSHLDINETEKVFNRWKQEYLTKIDFNNKIVLDYGIGRGFLGKILHTEYSINKYIGVDISERQIKEAKEYLKNTNSDFYLTPVNFNTLNPNIIICQSVIQHFPSEEYLIEFLNNINNSNATNVMLQIRFNEVTKFPKEQYKTQDDVVHACFTNGIYL